MVIYITANYFLRETYDTGTSKTGKGLDSVRQAVAVGWVGEKKELSIVILFLKLTSLCCPIQPPLMHLKLVQILVKKFNGI